MLATVATILDLPGVGAKVAALLQKMGIETLADFLFHLPRSYQDRTRLCPISDLQESRYSLVEGQVVQTYTTQSRRRMLICEIDDGTGTLQLRFFHFNRSQQMQMKRGATMRVFGEVKRFNWQLEIIHPEYQIVRSGEDLELEDTLTPVYSLTDGVSQKRFRNWMDIAFQQVPESEIAELLPSAVRAKMPSLIEALRFVHQPPPEAPVAKLLMGEHPMIRRLVFEELVAHSLSLQQLKHQVRQDQAPVFKANEDLNNRFLDLLPFDLTGAQKRVLAEIESDLMQPVPMLRLLQGDVGSGKTVVACLTALNAIAAGYQVAIMAPTEILAAQHYQNFLKWLEALQIPVALLVSKLGAKQRRSVIEAMADGKVSVVVGTQALFQDGVVFERLGLVIVDEQHRFGVEQRRALLEKGKQGNVCPHQLVMTATPIPRTLAMTVYADLDMSIIDELPPGRKPIQTVAVGNKRREEIVQRIQEYATQGHQVYWVCTLIEESEALNCEAAEKAAEKLQAQLKGLKVDLIHGRLKPAEKTDIMAKFKAGDIDVLVATTVIEVGVDVPNANMMVIENPERLGLSQLHQLRGRVGRGAEDSFCVLLYQTPLSETARARIQAMRDTTDGFVLAEKDLELRGPGEFLGTRQTGEMSFRFAEITRDRDLLPKAHEAAELILEKHSKAVTPLIKRWIGQSQAFSQV